MTQSSDATSRNVAERIEALRLSRGRSIAWLSEASGIADKTLRRRLNGSPEQFKLVELISITRVLDCTLEDLIEDAGLASVAA